MFGLKDVAVLWQQKYPSRTAGAALKRVVGARQASNQPRLRIGFVGVWRALRPVRNPETASWLHPLATQAEAGLGATLENGSAAQDSSALSLPRDAAGASTSPPPSSGWAFPARRHCGAAKFSPARRSIELKKEIARILARMKPVAGITRRDIGLPRLTT